MKYATAVMLANAGIQYWHRSVAWFPAFFAAYSVALYAR